MDSQFAIVTEKVLAMCVEAVDGHQVELTRGMMVEIKNFQDRYSTIVVHDYYQRNYAYENNLYLCKSSALFQVPLEVWPILIAVNDPYERFNMAKDKPYIQYILGLNEGSFVAVSGHHFNLSSISQSLSFLPEREPKDKSLDYHCAVRYIGPVDEIGPGCLFGLELLVNLQTANATRFFSANIPVLVEFLCSVD